WIIGILVVLLLISLFFKKDDQQKAGTTDGPIKIGFIGPLTGDAAAYGEPIKNAVALAVDEVNNNGGIDGRMVEAIYEDGACNGTDAANAASKLVNIDQVKIILGGFCSGESLSAEPIATQADVLLVSAASSSPDLTDISEYFVRTYPSDLKQSEILAEISAQDKGWKTVAVIQEQTDYALGLAKAFKEYFENQGGEAVIEEFASEETDFRTMLSKLTTSSPDALFISVQTPATAERILRQLNDLNIDIPLIVADALAGDSAVVKRNAVDLEGTLAAQFGINEDATLFQDFARKYEETYGRPVEFASYSAIAYDTGLLIADGLREVGENPKKLSQWLRNLDTYPGASGNIDIDSKGDRASGHTAQMIVDGLIVPYEN
ncbi:ABC transporter substrate-binding protein, partial [Patescibacteria group bacterium]|nr:ABC transporter substrate-binding protein [Patescibacteria group bacterium]